jgi:hypothetical protein
MDLLIGGEDDEVKEGGVLCIHIGAGGKPLGEEGEGDFSA